jgi:protein tyrosine/serine phosphatase
MNRTLPSLAILLLPLHVLAQSAPLTSAPSIAQPAFGQKLQIAGLPNAGKITDVLYRGSQPKGKGFEQLKKLGITTIVDLRRQHQGAVKTERKRVEALGMHFLYIPASGWSPPKDDELVQFFSLLQQHPEEKLYVHCWLGDDRTGVFLAAYRIAFAHWTAERALQEMYFFRFKRFWHPSMRIYIENFPAHFAESRAFAPFRSQSSDIHDH